jgi:hypothetical protein
LLPDARSEMTTMLEMLNCLNDHLKCLSDHDVPPCVLLGSPLPDVLSIGDEEG